jgi:hypothetical protein
MAGPRPRQFSPPRNKCPEVPSELPRSRKPDNLDSERRRAIRDQERVSKLELDRLVKAKHLLQSSDH